MKNEIWEQEAQNIRGNFDVKGLTFIKKENKIILIWNDVTKIEINRNNNTVFLTDSSAEHSVLYEYKYIHMSQKTIIIYIK